MTQHILIENDRASAGYRAHRQLWLRRQTELADHQDIKRHSASLRYLKGNRNTSADKTKNNSICKVRQSSNQLGEHLSRVMPILK